MLIAQISDCHVVPPGQRAYDRVDTGQMLRDAVKAISSLPKTPDLVIATGDLVQAGSAEEYATFRAIYSDLAIPLVPVVGNHDDRNTMTQAFGLDARPRKQAGFIQYVVEDYPVRILLLDSVTPGKEGPSFCRNRLDWAGQRLAEDDRPTLVALHHPPFPARIAWLEPADPNWASDLDLLVRHHPNIVRVIAGHVHRTMTAQWARACAMTAPSTAHQVFPDLSPNALPQLSFEAPGFLLHHWDGDEMTSLAISIPKLTDRFAPGG